MELRRIASQTKPSHCKVTERKSKQKIGQLLVLSSCFDAVVPEVQMVQNQAHNTTHSNGHTVHHSQTSRCYGRSLVVRTRGIVRSGDAGFLVCGSIGGDSSTTPEDADDGESEESQAGVQDYPVHGVVTYKQAFCRCSYILFAIFLLPDLTQKISMNNTDSHQDGGDE